VIIKLADQEARSIIERGRVGRLACVFNGEPYVVPVNYVFDRDNIYIHSRPGRKVDALRANPRACLLVDEIQDEFNWRSALAFGNYEEIQDQLERDLVVELFTKRFRSLTPVESVVELPASQPIVFRISVDTITGAGEGEAKSSIGYSVN